jgi:arylsulfatase
MAFSLGWSGWGLPVEAAAFTEQAVAPQRPNIVLVMPDDVGCGDYACLGNPVIRTPSVDRFRQQGLLLSRFHVSPTCSPCRAALLSGRHEFKSGVTHTILERERMSLSAYTIAELLRSAGYATGIFGKWHLGDDEAYRPERRGFDEVYIHGGGGIGQTYPGSCGDAPGNTNLNPAVWHNGRFEKTHGYCTDLFFAAALRWIDSSRSRGQPFFALVTPNAAHEPLVLPEAYYSHYIGRPGIDEKIARFYGMIENIDANFGQLLDRLDEWGLAEDTLVIYLTGDNGGTAGTKIFNAGLRGSKGTVYQGGTRAAAILRWPGGDILAGTTSDALCAHLDIFPTLAEVAGIELSDEIREKLDGRSLRPLFANSDAVWPDRLLVHHVGRWERGQAADAKYVRCAIQNFRYTLVNHRELYDLETDPGETRNVIDQHPAIADQLRAAYDQWWDAVQPLLVNEDAVGPPINPFKQLYWDQFGGGPDEELLRAMNPNSASARPAAKP